MTLNEIAYNIKNIVEGGIAGEDSNLSLTQIKHMIHYHRANLLTKYTDSGRYISDACCQTISGLNTSGSLSIGRVIGWPGNKAIKEVFLQHPAGGGVPKITNLSIVNPSERDFALATRFAPNQGHYFAIHNAPAGTIMTMNPDGSSYIEGNVIITAKVVLDNPTDASLVGGYPIPTELIASLTELVLAKEFNIYLRTSADNSNNSVDEKMSKMATPQTKAVPSANARSKRARTR